MKKLLSILLSSFMVLAMSACSGGGGGQTPTSGPVQISLTLWDEVQAPIIQQNVDKFNELHKGEIEATIEQVPWSNYWQKLDASLESGESADVMWMNTYLPKYVEGGVLKPLDEFIKADNYDLTQYVDARVQAFNYDGAQYCLPKGLDAVYVALNTEIFTKYNVELPQDGWTWDDMRTIAGPAPNIRSSWNLTPSLRLSTSLNKTARSICLTMVRRPVSQNQPVLIRYSRWSI